MEPIRIPPYHYIHVLDTNKCITKVVTGPTVYVCQVHEKIVKRMEPMIVIPANHFVIVENPVMRISKDGKLENDKVDVADSAILFDEFGQAKLRHGESEVRFEQDSHPLYPGESLKSKITTLSVVKEGTALRLTATRDLFDAFAQKSRKGGEEWLLHGPITLIPQVYCEVLETVSPIVINPNEGLILSASKDCVDVNGHKRKAGEKWMIRETGAYLPRVDEIVVQKQKGIILTDKKAVHLRALDTFFDVYGKERKAGAEWLVTSEDSEVHIPDVTGREELVQISDLITLEQNQYIYIEDPVDEDGVPQLGKKVIVCGPKNFFLQPGERRSSAIQRARVMGPEQSLQLIAHEEFDDIFASKDPIHRRPGVRYYVYGPTSYMVPPEAKAVRERRAEISIESLGVNIFFTTPLPVLIVLFSFLAAIYLIAKLIF